MRHVLVMIVHTLVFIAARDEISHQIHHSLVGQLGIREIQGVNEPTDRSGPVSPILVSARFYPQSLFPLGVGGQMPELAALDQSLVVRFEISGDGPGLLGCGHFDGRGESRTSDIGLIADHGGRPEEADFFVPEDFANPQGDLIRKVAPPSGLRFVVDR